MLPNRAISSTEAVAGGVENPSISMVFGPPPSRTGGGEAYRVSRISPEFPEFSDFPDQPKTHSNTAEHSGVRRITLRTVGIARDCSGFLGSFGNCRSEQEIPDHTGLHRITRITPDYPGLPRIFLIVQAQTN